MARTTLLAAILITIGLAGCDGLSDPGAQAHLGVIGSSALRIAAPDREIADGFERIWLEDLPGGLAESFYEAPPPTLDAPDTVQAGESFTVWVRTYWPNSCLAAAGTEIYEGPSVRIIVPWDVDENEVDRDVGCAQVPVELTRELSFEFASPGTATIELRGRRFHDEPSQDPGYYRVKEIVVQ